MHTICVHIRKDHPVTPYLKANMTGSRAVRNAANYLIRNVYTALGKPEWLRTSRERCTLVRVSACIRRANEQKEALYEKRLAAGWKDKKGNGPVLRPMPYPDEKNRMLSYEQIDAILKFTDDPAYRACTSQVNQQAIRKTRSSWDSFFKALKGWKKDPSSYTGRPRIPGYLRGETATACFPSGVSKVTESERGPVLTFACTDGTVLLGGMPMEGKYVHTEVTSGGDGLMLHLTFDDAGTIPEVPEHPDKVMAGDPGVGNFLTLVTNTGMTPLIIDGHYLKAVNQFYNKERARLVSRLTGGKPSTEWKGCCRSAGLERLAHRRAQVLRDCFYKIAHRVCREAEREGITLIVIGHNKRQKDGVSMGHVSDQNFVGIPFEKFFHILQCTGAKYGIAVTQSEESYTSKADFLCGDAVPVYGREKETPVFSGRRVHRGLYRSGTGKLLNADVNGAANILRKYCPQAAKTIDPDSLFSVRKVVWRDLYPIAGKSVTS